MNRVGPQVDWIAVDWGTSRLRAWAVSREGTVLASAESNAGMGGLTQEGFEPALMALIEPWLSDGTTDVLACGMVGSRQGWQEAGYASVPVSPKALRPERVASVKDPRIAVWIVPGLSQSRPADIMRGEETQIAGFLAHQPEFDGVLCLPGTHTKWVRISAEEVVGFQTFMTGEIFDLLATQSVLKHSVAAAELDFETFDEAVLDAIGRPERLAQRLFSIRAEGTLTDLSAEVARAKLSGALIGTELAAARGYWLGQNVAVAAAPALAELYARALRGQGAPVQAYAADQLTQAGLGTLWQHMALKST